MKRLIIAIALFATPALAEDPPTVTLTQAELQAVIQAASMKAIAEQEAAKSTAVFAKIQAAFAPKPPAPVSTPAPSK